MDPKKNFSGQKHAKVGPISENLKLRRQIYSKHMIILKIGQVHFYCNSFFFGSWTHTSTLYWPAIRGHATWSAEMPASLLFWRCCPSTSPIGCWWGCWHTIEHWMLNTEQNTVSTLDDDKKSGASGCSLVKKIRTGKGVGEGYFIFFLLAPYVPNVAKRSTWNQCNIEDRPTTDLCSWKSFSGKTSNGHVSITVPDRRGNNFQ